MVIKVTIGYKIRNLLKGNFDVININVLSPESSEKGCGVGSAIPRVIVGRLKFFILFCHITL